MPSRSLACCLARWINLRGIKLPPPLLENICFFLNADLLKCFFLPLFLPSLLGAAHSFVRSFVRPSGSFLGCSLNEDLKLRVRGGGRDGCSVTAAARNAD